MALDRWGVGSAIDTGEGSKMAQSRGRKDLGAGRGVGDSEAYQQSHQRSVAACASKTPRAQPKPATRPPRLAGRPQEPASLWAAVPEALCSPFNP